MRISVVMSVRDDPFGAIVTARAALEELKAADGGEVVIVDNSTSEDRSFILHRVLIDRDFIQTGQIRYISHPVPCLFTAREHGVRASRNDLIIFVDSHVLFGRDCLKDLSDFAEERKKDPRLGFMSLPFCRALDHERRSLHSRNPETFSAERLIKPSTRRIPFKGMPLAFFREHFNRIGGYGALSRHVISWGGGDMHLGMKSVLLGFDNWLVQSSPVIHFGRISKRDTVFHGSHHGSQSGEHPRWIGFVLSAYICGGESLMRSRAKQVEERIVRKKYFTSELFDLIKALGAREKEWLDENRKYTYEEFVKLRPWESDQEGEAPEVSQAPEWEPEEIAGLDDIPDSEFEEPEQEVCYMTPLSYRYTGRRTDRRRVVRSYRESER